METKNKLREALIKIRDLTEPCEGVTEVELIINDIAISALSAPPRNCDIAQDWLRDLYVKFKPPASVKREMPPEWVDAVMVFCRWLLAPAAVQEGGVK